VKRKFVGLDLIRIFQIWNIMKVFKLWNFCREREKNRNGRDIDKLGSIGFSDAAYKIWRTFIINREDFDFIKYLNKSYHSFILCIRNNYLKNISSLTNNAVRHLYYITEGN
jgi:hypothetical protein